MEDKSTGYYDIPTFLKQGDFDVRAIAAANPSLTVLGFFSMLSEFIGLMPNVTRALIQLSTVEAKKDDFGNYQVLRDNADKAIVHNKGIKDMIALLTEMGYEKFISGFNYIFNTAWDEEATIYARHLIGELEAIRDLINTAKRLNKPESLYNEKNRELSLQEYINLLEEKYGHKPSILAIDDSLVVLNTLSSVLKDEYEVFTLPKPAELEKVLKKLTPDLFLIDYMMPEIDGFELVTIIRRMEKYKDTPIIFLTSAGTFDNVTTALSLGASDFIVKPFDRDVLCKKIEKYIVKK